MIHFQNPEPHWTEALPFLPDGSLIKAVGNPGLLMDAKQKWAALGRDPKRLTTMYRHADVYSYPTPNDPQGAVAHWVEMYNRWFDGTYRDRYLSFVDLCCEANEYSSNSTWTDPADKALKLQNVWAAGTAWNDHFRKLTPNTRVCLLAGPVSNDVPDEVMRWAVEMDLPVDYHAYTHCVAGARTADDWHECSGRWDWMEQRAGVRPEWVFGEAGPFSSMDGGWRSSDCLGGDEAKLVGTQRDVVHDAQKTDAYQTGRLLGFAMYGAGQVGWPDYWLQSPQLIDLAKMFGAEWKPGNKMEARMTIELAKLSNYILGLQAIETTVGGLKAGLLAEGPAPLYQASQDLLLRDAAGVPARDPLLAPDGVIRSGTIVPVYQAGVVLAGYAPRSAVTPDGKTAYSAGLKKL